jgi:uncharacterized protein (TIGR00251 family)
MRITQDAGGIRFAVKVVPGASRDRVIGALGDALKISVRKPPEGGAANAAVVEVLAKALGVPRASVQIVRGYTSPRKEIHVTGISEAHARACLILLPGGRMGRDRIIPKSPGESNGEACKRSV